MSKVLSLIGVSDNFNQILVNFIQYVPYNQMNEMNSSVYNSRRNTEDIRMPFFDTNNYVVD